MEQVTVSSNEQISLPKQVRDALNLAEGSKLNVEVRGHYSQEEQRLEKAPGCGMRLDASIRGLQEGRARA